MERDPKNIAAVVVTFGLLAAGLWLAFAELAEWAAGAFARPLMGAALVAVIELGLLVLALALASPLSFGVRRLLGRSSAPEEATPPAGSAE